MSRVMVVTADFGNHDNPPNPPCPQDVPDVEWHYYTDRDEPAAAPWVTHHVDGTFDDPQLSAKAYRCTPWAFPEIDSTTDDVIWIDANMQILAPDFVRGALAARSDGIAAWAHPRRDCIYDELDAALGPESQGGRWEGYRAAMEAQVRSYRDEGYPAHQGLYATGTIAWDLANPAARRLGDAWLRECARWSPMCQLSLPVVAWRAEVEVGTYPLPQLERRYRIGNRWVRILPHRAKVTP